MEYTRKQVDDIFEKLPTEIQEEVDSSEITGFLKQTEKKYNLQRKQTKELSAEVGSLMFGISPPQHFIENIQKSMGVSEETAKNIASEVNEKIFRPIKESLKTIHSLNKKEETHKVNIIPSESLIETKESASVKNFGETREEPKVETVDPYRESV